MASRPSAAEADASWFLDAVHPSDRHETIGEALAASILPEAGGGSGALTGIGAVCRAP